ncbi:MAG TPA: DUF4013 domain-containing protein [Methanothermococcus okinawensis]|uniref:DUF4013 domain-containing protein n=1 Tax=Methanothermococcus okinawensis TaxID=155863 RepID=A0A832ZJR6_9EURY|nr:DUF4013 domain-containing protein [Methanothermococcus okinawensis]
MLSGIMSFIEKYIVEPFKYATSDLDKIIIGGMLLFFNSIVDSLLPSLEGSPTYGQILGVCLLIFIITLILNGVVLGYYIGVIKNTLKGLDILPDWSNIVELLTDGILYSIALLLLVLMLLIPVGLLFMFILALILVSENMSYYDPTVVVVVLIPLILLMIVLFIVLDIYESLATVNFAKKGFFGFFEIRDILKKISLEYLGIWFLYTLCNSLVSLIFKFSLQYSLYVNDWILLCLVILIVSPITFIPSVMFYRAVAKYYLEREGKIYIERNKVN